MSVARASLAAPLQEESTKHPPLSSKKKPHKTAKASRRQAASVGAETVGAALAATASQAPVDAVPLAQTDPPAGAASRQGSPAKLSKRSGSAGRTGHPERAGAAARNDAPEWMMCPLSKVCNQLSQVHVVLLKVHSP